MKIVFHIMTQIKIHQMTKMEIPFHLIKNNYNVLDVNLDFMLIFLQVNVYNVNQIVKHVHNIQIHLI